MFPPWLQLPRDKSHQENSRSGAASRIPGGDTGARAGHIPPGPERDAVEHRFMLRHRAFPRAGSSRAVTARKGRLCRKPGGGESGLRGRLQPLPRLLQPGFSATTVFCSPGAQRRDEIQGAPRCGSTGSARGRYTGNGFGLGQIREIWGFKRPSVTSWVKDSESVGPPRSESPTKSPLIRDPQMI